MGTEIGVILAYAFGLLMLYIVGYLFLGPAKLLMKVLLNSLIGGAVILLINWAGAFWDFHIPLNLISAFCVGVLGVPGVILWIVLTYFLLP
ncbi:MAG: pro-sigmaK processing inhibitor BofA family protein [Bacillota bacterium]|nr:pro-sigmaK processing inhibitor BofA family protein [Bacillota bacterium]